MMGGLTVCVTCVWASVDSAWEQEKPKARKMLENAAESHTSGARCVSPRILEDYFCHVILKCFLRYPKMIANKMSRPTKAIKMGNILVAYNVTGG